MQLNPGKEDGGVSGKDAIMGEGKVGGFENLGGRSQAGAVGKGCYVSCQEDQTTYFGLHCAPAYCADVKIHTARIGLQQNTLIPSNLPATPIMPIAHGRKSISTPKITIVLIVASVYGQL